MAYGTNGRWGLKPVMYLNGTPWNGATREYPITSTYVTGLFTGDPVITLSDGTIGICGVGGIARGVFMGVKYTDTAGVFQHSPYWPAGTTVLTGSAIRALIADDPNLVMDVQEASTATTAGTALALADVGLNANFGSGAGSTATGISGYFLDNDTENTTSTLSLKILGLTPHPENVVGNFANWLVTWNTHELKSVGTTGV